MLFFTVPPNQRIVIARRFCGPPDSGNGGYSSGLIANAISQNAECTLRKPIPIEREMLIFFEHDPSIAAGFIREENGKRRVVPAVG